jgi:hypothetical protein
MHRLRRGLNAALNQGGAAAVPWYLNSGILLSDIAAVWQPVKSASLGNSYLRIAGDEGNANLDPAVVGGTAPTFRDIYGWILNGTTTYLKTGYIPSSSNYSLFIKYADSEKEDTWIVGSKSAAQARVGIAPNVTGNSYIYANGNTTYLTKTGSGMPSGVLGYAGATAYRDGAPNGTIPVATPGAIELYIGARNNNGTAESFADGSVQAIIIIKRVVTDAEALALSTDMLAISPSNNFTFTGGSFAWFTDVHGGDTTSWPAGTLAAWINKVNSLNPSLVISTGDNVNDGDTTPPNPLEHIAFDVLLAGLSAPYKILNGNHDGATTYLNRFVFDFNDLRFIAFNATLDGNVPLWNGAVSAAEIAWLTKKLQQVGSQKPIVMCHFPLLRANTDMTIKDPELTSILALCDTYNVVAFLSGHAHDAWMPSIVQDGTVFIDGSSLVGSLPPILPTGHGFAICNWTSGHLSFDFYNGRTPFTKYGAPDYTTIDIDY